MADEKNRLRRIFRECRNALDADYAATLACRIQQNLLETSCYAAADRVALYAAAGHEVSTGMIMRDALRSGRRVYLPRIAPERRNLQMVRVNDPSEMRLGAFGIPEPSGAEVASSRDLRRALICVPGLAFSLAGGRLGRGGGHYDRFLAGAAEEAVAAGLAYDFQVLDRLPEEPHDRRLGLIVTESAVLRPAQSVMGAAARPDDQGGMNRCCWTRDC